MIDPVNKQRFKNRVGDAGIALSEVFKAASSAKSEEDVKSVLVLMDKCCGAMQEATFALEQAAGYRRNPTLSTCGSCGLPRLTKVVA
jgi:hypothetical protein